MKDIKYFEGFNALRFLAAFVVLIGHIEQARQKFDFFTFSGKAFVHRGSYGVMFFFVLSGFLISYLLFQEHEVKGNISIKNFYLRRVFRIWPLYFLLIFIGLGLIPLLTNWLGIQYEGLPFWSSLTLFVLMLPNLVTPLFGSSFLTPLWSIGVEEQFYLLWAPIAKFFKSYFLQIILSIIIARLLFYHFATTWEPIGNWLYFKEFLLTLKFECMAIGALGAQIVFYHFTERIRNILFNTYLQLVLWLIVFIGFVSQFMSYNIPFVSPVIPALVFLALIINVGVNPKSIIKLRSAWINKLGEWSYGIYMYHSIVTFALLSLFEENLRALPAYANTLVIYTACIGGTILIAALSYRLYELPFIKLKHRLT